MNTVMMTHTTTHRGTTSTKVCTMIEGKKFCEVEEPSPHEVGTTMLGIFGAIVFWAILSFITYKTISTAFKLDILDDWSLPVLLFSGIAPLGYLGLFLALFG